MSHNASVTKQEKIKTYPQLQYFKVIKAKFHRDLEVNIPLVWFVLELCSTVYALWNKRHYFDHDAAHRWSNTLFLHLLICYRSRLRKMSKGTTSWSVQQICSWVMVWAATANASTAPNGTSHFWKAARGYCLAGWVSGNWGCGSITAQHLLPSHSHMKCFSFFFFHLQ